MKKNWKAFMAGILTALLLCTVVLPSLAAGRMTTLPNVMMGGVRIVIDGKELHPADEQGNTVEPLIYNGTTYLPVRAVSSALGKAVYWDGPSYTVYLGSMNGKMEYPTAKLTDLKSISDEPRERGSITDNYGNRYSYHIGSFWGEEEYEYLTNMKYTHLKGTLYIREGETSDGTGYMQVIADGKVLYTSPEMDKRSAPVAFDVPIQGYNDIMIKLTKSDLDYLCLGDAGFYQ